MKIVTVIGARPQFIKAFAVSRAIDDLNHSSGREIIKEVLVDTGQHYDHNMAAIFFKQLNMRKPDYQLGIGSGHHGRQTGDMISRIEEVLLDEIPDMLLVYGDTNSTLAGALAAAKMHVPVVHVEAGLRSFRKGMPEELNRLLTDHMASLLFCPSNTAVNNLCREGFDNVVKDGTPVCLSDAHNWRQELAGLSPDKPLVANVGDVMHDAVLYCSELPDGTSDEFHEPLLRSKHYVLLTLHRAENTDCRERLALLLDYVRRVAQNIQVVFPLHPRTKKALADFALSVPSRILCIDPVGYLEIIKLIKNSRAIMTDSGGMQKEAMWLGVPCITLRGETEWVETVLSGWNRLWQDVPAGEIYCLPMGNDSHFYGNGDAGKIIATMLGKVKK